MASKKGARPGAEQKERKESIFLTILPFAGLGLLVVVGLLWRPASEEEEIPKTERDVADLVIRRWEQQPVQEIPVEPGRDFTLGPADAPITIVEFSDFQCPYCRNATGVTKELLANKPDTVRLVFKNLPLDVACNDNMRQQLHPFACETAVMARCAGAQREELFWETHDALFNVRRLSRETVDAIPEVIDVSQENLKTCMSSETPLNEVKEDIALATILRVNSTPVFFLNGRRVSDYRFGSLEALVEYVLEKAGD